MAELATIARPYAEALFKAARGDLSAEVAALSDVAKHEQLRQFADNPKVSRDQVYAVIADVVKTPLSPPAQNLLRAVIDNGRLAALPEIAAQYHALVKSRSGTSDATIESAYPIDAALLPQVVAALEKRFGRKLNASVEVTPELIGGIRVTVGDEVLDTSVRARLEKMRLALAA